MKKLSKNILILALILTLFLITIPSASATEHDITNTTTGGLNKTVTDASNGDIINLEEGTYKGNNNTNITINTTKNITIQSKNPNQQSTIDGESINWFINNGGDLTLKNLIIQNFVKKATSGANNLTSGGAIYNTGRLTIINCTFINNTAGLYGGAIYTNRGNQSIINCAFTNNSAQSGGAIFTPQPTIVENSTFTNNKANSAGGAIYVNGFYSMNIYNSTFINNSANGRGGAIYNAYSSNFNVTRCDFINNTATNGGAISNDNNGNINVSYSRFVNNTDSNNYTIYNTNSNITLNLNWWGSNIDPNLQIYNRATVGSSSIVTLNNYFVMNVTNLTSLDPTNGTVTFNYTFKLNTTDLFDTSLLPFFITNVYTNLTTGGFFEDFDARFDKEFSVIVQSTFEDQPIEFIFVTDNELQKLQGNIAPRPEPKPTNITTNSPKGKNGETVNLTATLTDENGNPIVGKEITFNIAGKTFTTITDANGIATIQYTINKDDFIDDKLVFTASFAGDENYLASTNTGAVTLIEKPEPPIPPKPPEPTPTPTPTPTPEPNNNETNKTSKNPIPASAATTKTTGIPINIILIVLLSILGILVGKKQ